MGLEGFAKAISNALKKIAERGLEVVDVDEIWIDTSIPRDLIAELVRNGEVEVPEGIDEIRSGKKVLWRRER